MKMMTRMRTLSVCDRQAQLVLRPAPAAPARRPCVLDLVYAAMHDSVELRDCVDGDVMMCKPGAFGAGT